LAELREAVRADDFACPRLIGGVIPRDELPWKICGPFKDQLDPLLAFGPGFLRWHAFAGGGR